MPRARVVESAAAISRREAFIGPSPERERAARALIVLGSGTADADLEAVLEHVKKVPLPILKRLAELELRVFVVRGSVAEHHKDLGALRPSGLPPRVTWRQIRTAFSALDREVVIATGGATRAPRALAPPPGALLLRELGRAIDHLYTREPPSSTLAEAQAAEREQLDPFHARDDAIGRGELFAELFSRVFRGDPALRLKLPALSAAFDAIFDRWVSEEEARTHPTRMKRVTWFLRKHVLGNDALSPSAKALLSQRAQREIGPWERRDLEKHLLAVSEEGGAIRMRTRWGELVHPLGGELDPEAEAARVEAFLRQFVRENPRLSRATKARLEERALKTYGPWRMASAEGKIKAIFERAGRVLIKTDAGDDPLDG